jgi:membrane-associated protein
VSWLDPQQILIQFSGIATLAVALMVFVENSFVLTSFLPGDSLLFVLGVTLAVSGGEYGRFALALISVFLSAFVGSQIAFETGVEIGPPLFERRHNWIFNPTTVNRSHEIFEKYGARAILLARFVPIVRALVPMLAGISKLERRKFVKYNAIGASIWVVGFISAGFFLGTIPWVRLHLDQLVIGVVILTSLPFPIEVVRTWLKLRAQKRHAARE